MNHNFSNFFAHFVQKVVFTDTQVHKHLMFTSFSISTFSEFVTTKEWARFISISHASKIIPATQNKNIFWNPMRETVGSGIMVILAAENVLCNTIGIELCSPQHQLQVSATCTTRQIGVQIYPDLIHKGENECVPL